MSAYITETRVAPAHDGEAELIVTLEYENGGKNELALDHMAVQALMQATGSSTSADLLGASWEHVRDAISHSYNRFQSNS